MEFGSLVKVPDGRYYLKVSGSNRAQFNNIMTDSFMGKPILLSLNDQQTEQIKSLESQVLERAKKNSVEWFSREIAEATIEKAFQSSLSTGSFEVALSSSKGRVTTTFWNTDKTQKELDSDWSSGADIIVELSGVWFLKRSFGPIFKILQVKSTKPKKVVEYLFKDEDPSDDEDYLD